MEELIQLRHDLHRLAEVSGEENETARYIKEFLASTDPDEIITEIGGHGIAACYESNKTGPSVLLRCELDALPIPEENDIEYKSKDPKTGHKCGHDGHMAIICGVAKKLAARGVEAGSVTLLFQPAEETGQGGTRVLNDKKFQQIQPDYVFALHNLPGFEKGTVVLKENTFAAASIGFIASLKGESSHAGHPEQGRSPALAMAQLVQSLSSIPQFDTPLQEAAKVTVIHARLGERAFGTSPGYADVMATLRTYDDGLLKAIRKKAEDLAKNLAKTYHLEVETEWVESFPATNNDREMVSLIEEVATRKNISILQKKIPFSWSEDFGCFTNKFTGAIFGLGSGKEHPVLHAPDYDFPDEIISTGVDMFIGIIDKIQANYT